MVIADSIAATIDSESPAFCSLASSSFFAEISFTLPIYSEVSTILVFAVSAARVSASAERMSEREALRVKSWE